MKFTTTSILALAAGANAHTLMSEIYIEGKPQGDAVCVRTPKEAEGANNPIMDFTSKDMACGKDGENGVARVCPIKGGNLLTFEFREWPDIAANGPLDIGHYGPCAVYLKQVDSAVQDGGAGDGWFKLWDEGYDESEKKWCTTKLIENEGRLSVTIPESLKGGNYLVRSELIALHNANKGAPEVYAGCTQMYLESSGSEVPESTVSIPGHMSKDAPGIDYNIYAKPLSLPYIVPGPAVYNGTSSSSVVSTSNKIASTQTEGLPDKDCVVTNANWCGKEVPSYSNENGCWAASKDCWAQSKKCYASAPPTGAKGCEIWADKCNNLDDSCNSGDFKGPSNAGKNLDPVLSVIKVPAAVNSLLNYGSMGGSSNNKVVASSSEEAAPASSSAAPVASSSAEVSEATSAAYVAPTSVAESSAPAAAPSAAAATSAAAEESYDSEDSNDEDEDSEDSDDEDDSDSVQTTTQANRRHRGHRGFHHASTSAAAAPATTVHTTFATQVVTANEYQVETVNVVVTATAY